ncbi:hypothetical protein Sf12_gp34 [Shigella phage Sf12]|uniref:Uncharacterized protein n=1 Tax=Shigella phage Sf12 TaxID=2024315 RepID=A0A291AXR4_9CAUD|nr:hypothetical protein HOR99_gp33 [Shigella phage Sf12]ATE85760.1 hypothetical protein Sf12_gp34 [Shigella phage Sf12]
MVLLKMRYKTMNTEKAKSYMMKNSRIESMTKTSEYIKSLDFNDESYRFVLATVKSVKGEFEQSNNLVNSLIELAKINADDFTITVIDVYLEEQTSMIGVIEDSYRFIETCEAIEESKNIKQYN